MDGRDSPFAWTLALTLGFAAFLAPAVWNGFPFVFYDSGDYIEAAFSHEMPPFRLLPYAFVVALGRPVGSPWAAVPFQITVQLAVLALLARLPATPGAPKRFLLAALGSALLTSAPWFAGLLMPDAFAAPAILAAALVLAGWTRLGRGRWLALFLVPLCGMVHATHLIVLAGLSGLGLLLWRWNQVPRAAALALAGATCVAWLAPPALHAATQGGWFYNRGGSVFLLARLVSAGLVQEELPRLCADRPWRICAIEDRLYGDENDFLWGHGGVFFGRAGPIGDWLGESPELVRRVVLAHPGRTLGFVVRTAARQAAAFGPGDVFDPLAFHMQHALERRWPDAVPHLLNARQEHGLAGAKAWLQGTGMVTMAVGQAGLILILVLAIRCGDSQCAVLAGLVLAGLLGNALACGGLSSLADRYQARVAWLGVAVVLANTGWLSRRWRAQRL